MRVISVLMAGSLAVAAALLADVPSASAGLFKMPNIRFVRAGPNRCSQTQTQPGGGNSACNNVKPCGFLCSLRAITHPNQH